MLSTGSVERMYELVDVPDPVLQIIKLETKPNVANPRKDRVRSRSFS